MKKFRKKPVVIEAIQFERGMTLDNICAFITDVEVVGYSSGDTDVLDYFDIPTLEGVMTASIGDWIIRGVNGEYYPCKSDIFEKTYEEV